MKENKYSRRNFISKCAGGCITLLGASFLLHSCGNNSPSPAENKGDSSKSAATTADACKDFSGVSAEELEKRKKMGYVDQSTVAGNSCANCGLYVTTSPEAPCGKCLLFKGPVMAEGHCVQYVAKTAQQG